MVLRPCFRARESPQWHPSHLTDMRNAGSTRPPQLCTHGQCGLGCCPFSSPPASAFPSGQWGNRTDQTWHGQDLEQSTSKTHVLFISGIGMFLTGGFFPYVVPFSGLPVTPLS